MKAVLLGEELNLDPNDLSWGEGIKIERTYGGSFASFGKALSDGNLEALRAFIVVLKQRTEPGFRVADFDALKIGDIDFQVESTDATGDEPSGADLPDPTTAA